jgi:hypothetical protein
MLCSEGKCVDYKYLTELGVFNYTVGGTLEVKLQNDKNVDKMLWIIQRVCYSSHHKIVAVL